MVDIPPVTNSDNKGSPEDSKEDRVFASPERPERNTIQRECTRTVPPVVSDSGDRVILSRSLPGESLKVSEDSWQYSGGYRAFILSPSSRFTPSCEYILPARISSGLS
ncbi:MAG TPA: hypothetical protein PLN56_07035 [Methanoregulaceae archaeon]|nr:MAG: hypothetical protein IPI71_05835 [Methanolinea sp.]HON81979.1 hypothetical protein [Methanoregulaceae archaeon]HPD10735.1 hypothetical protein [Methanoregulaceae archaeon]HRT15864.1 hypothetical protein [Methanoregulaceae archaeon]HRU31621.1 hypothetical protein [Methanoregulaceae archaeon]